MGPPALSGSFTTRARRANERAKHYRTHLMPFLNHYSWPILASRGTFNRACRGLGFHPLDPLRPPLRSLERLGEIPTVSPHLSVAQLED
jgi:hypothetical protein